MSTAFERYIGIDYSGAQTPASSLKGLPTFDMAVCLFVAEKLRCFV
jgi:hypothetical protein